MKAILPTRIDAATANTIVIIQPVGIPIVLKIPFLSGVLQEIGACEK
jgi:hypothetical protein